MSDRKSEILMTVQQALLGEVSAQLRAITVSYGDLILHLDCYYDGEIQEDDRESMSCVETELMAHFPANYQVTCDIHRHDYPAPIPKDVIWAFFRKE